MGTALVKIIAYCDASGETVPDPDHEREEFASFLTTAGLNLASFTPEVRKQLVQGFAEYAPWASLAPPPSASIGPPSSFLRLPSGEVVPLVLIAGDANKQYFKRAD